MLVAVLVLRASVVWGGWSARERGTVARPAGAVLGTGGRDGHEQARLDLMKGHFCGEAGVAAAPNGSDRANDNVAVDRRCIVRVLDVDNVSDFCRELFLILLLWGGPSD